MTTQAWVSLVACAGLLALAGLALLRVGRSPMALPLAVLAIALSTWNFADFALARSGEPGWRHIATAAALISAPLALHFILAFVGERRRLAGAMFAGYGLFGALGATALVAALGSARLAEVVGSRGFALGALGLCAPLLLGCFGLLGWHLQREVRSTERTRAGLLILSLALLVTLLATDLAAGLGQDVPRLGNVGTVLSLPAIAVVALRLRLFGMELSQAHALYALLLSLVGVLSYLAIFRLFAESGARVVGTAAITLSLLVITRRGVIAFVTQRERLEKMATLGRFSAQMAHDLKNPIAALKGAAQYLKEEHKRGLPWDDKGEFLDLLLEQVERLDRVVSTYQRLGRVEPLMQPLDLNELARSVLSLQGFAGHPEVHLRQELAPQLPRCAGDWDLLANAVENLVRNGLEAMPRGGSLTVRTRREGAGVVLGVEDTGEGMNARTRERAFDDFYTTKATGSGLGLAFVRRVVEAHGGRVTLTSREGRGTTVTLRLPLFESPGEAAGSAESKP